MDINAFRRNTAMVEDGQWVSDIPDAGNMRLKVRGLTSKVVSALRARKERAVPRADRERDGSLSQETTMRISREVLHEAVLIDWDNLSEGDKPVKYSVDLAGQWLKNPDYIEFANAVANAAMIVDRGRADATDDLVGN